MITVFLSFFAGRSVDSITRSLGKIVAKLEAHETGLGNRVMALRQERDRLKAAKDEAIAEQTKAGAVREKIAALLG